MICGSLAYDTIMVFPQRFKDHILPDQAHILNVAFLVPELRRNFGGCAGNIAYTLHRLGAEALPMAAVGRDFGAYASYLDEVGICRDFVLQVEDAFTAQAFITTDIDDNQITAFHPGAMDHNHHNRIPTDRGVRLGIISPDGKQAMIEHATEFRDAGIRFVFDPGQALPMFDHAELEGLAEGADWLIVNSYEWQLLSRTTGWSIAGALERLRGGLIITHGADGSELFDQSGAPQRIKSVQPTRVADPTGCGDAYRAGFLYGLDRGWEPVEAARLGSLLGSIKIAHPAPQGHLVDRERLADQFFQAFGHPIPS